jgi:N-acetylglucosaminyldiphosphoundecaprenol N-acetyl-beta-D-mannosaminyltransferase
MDEAVDEIERLVERGRERGTTHQVATVNVDFVVNAIRDQQVFRILSRTDLSLADGLPIVWASAQVGVPIPERVTGADLVPALAERSARTGLHVHLFGSADGVAERAAALLVERHPGARITADSGPMIRDPRAPEPALVERLAAVDADVICVAFGNPKQEHFIDAVRPRGVAPVMIGVGGTLDMLVGGRKRAPRWIQRSGLEWVFRAAQEPRRLGRRYANDIVVFGPRLARFLWHARALRRSDPARPVGRREGPALVVDLHGRDTLTMTDLGDIVAVRREAHDQGIPVRLTGEGAGLRRRLHGVSAEWVLDG